MDFRVTPCSTPRLSQMNTLLQHCSNLRHTEKGQSSPIHAYLLWVCGCRLEQKWVTRVRQYLFIFWRIHWVLVTMKGRMQKDCKSIFLNVTDACKLGSVNWLIIIDKKGENLHLVWGFQPWKGWAEIVLENWFYSKKHFLKTFSNLIWQTASYHDVKIVQYKLSFCI